MNCYFCNKQTISDFNGYECRLHQEKVHYFPIYNLLKDKYEEYVIHFSALINKRYNIFIYPHLNQLLLCDNDNEQIKMFDFIPDITPDNAKDKLSNLLVFL